MFLPTHTPAFSLFLYLSLCRWQQQQQQQTLKVPPKATAAELSSSNHGLMKHSAPSYKEQQLTLQESYFSLCFAIRLLVVYLTACRCSLVFC